MMKSIITCIAIAAASTLALFGNAHVALTDMIPFTPCQRKAPVLQTDNCDDAYSKCVDLADTATDICWDRLVNQAHNCFLMAEALNIESQYCDDAIDEQFPACQKREVAEKKKCENDYTDCERAKQPPPQPAPCPPGQIA